MAGVFFTAGETKKRPGVYNRYEKPNGSIAAGASDGIVAAIINCNWGELNKVVDVVSLAQANEVFGTTGNSFVIEEAFNGGASRVRVVRIGTGGTKATASLMDTESTAAINVTAKYVGTRGLSYMVRGVIGDSTKMELVLLENGRIIEKHQFSAADSVNALLKISHESKYLNFELVGGYDATGKALAPISETAMTDGTNPTVTNEDYSTALSALEPYRWNTLCIDTCDVAVRALVTAYMTRIYQDGHTGYAVLGDPTSHTLISRLSNSAACNDYKVLYVGGGWYDSSDVLVDGVRAAARIAGLVAGTPSNQSITHAIIKGADRPAEMLTNAQYESCIDNGMIVFSQSPTGGVWVESGITTLVNPTGEDDDGWKKIKRTKIRFELMDRVNDTVAPLIGKINNDEDGRATVIQSVRAVLNAMVNEKKIFADTADVKEDADNVAVGDSAWFVITADDIDSLEKIYFTYKFRFAANS